MQKMKTANQRLEDAAKRAPRKRGAPPAALVNALKRPSLLTFSEKERLQKKVAEDARLLRQCMGQDQDGDGEIFLGPTQSYAGFNVSTVQNRLKRNKAQLERMDPANHKLQGADRMKAEKRMKELEEKLKKNMLSTFEMGYFPKKDDAAKDADYRRACEKSFKMEVGNPEFQRMAVEYKHLARRLDPDNPELPNIERLRSRKRY